VTVEACKRGLPVVGAAAGETPRLLDQGRAGSLYPVGDAAALARAVRELLQDRSRYAAVARAGWERAVATYTPEHCADGFLAVADEVSAR
jgi:glycosyltransferase involved in cell wall biosynthesis